MSFGLFLQKVFPFDFNLSNKLINFKKKKKKEIKNLL
jgi:hypothetical protein